MGDYWYDFIKIGVKITIYDDRLGFSNALKILKEKKIF